MERYIYIYIYIICWYLLKSPVVPHLRLNMKPCDISYLI